MLPLQILSLLRCLLPRKPVQEETARGTSEETLQSHPKLTIPVGVTAAGACWRLFVEAHQAGML